MISPFWAYRLNIRPVISLSVIIKSIAISTTILEKYRDIASRDTFYREINNLASTNVGGSNLTTLIETCIVLYN